MKSDLYFIEMLCLFHILCRIRSFPWYDFALFQIPKNVYEPFE